MNCIKVYLILLLSGLSVIVKAQNTITAIVVEQETNQPIVGASITIQGNKTAVAFTDNTGRFTISNATGKNITISFLGFKKLTAKAQNNATYRLMSTIAKVGEVVVTAQESKSLGAASVIQRHAMEHLQPSSFSDLLELLPGGRSKDPRLSTPNQIRLREAIPPSNSQYATSSLGTSFVIDGAPISTNANMQQLKGAWETLINARENVNEGVDMRTISTDDIEKVEIVRGIPSVEYGDLTSGLVKIERKRGGNALEARLKADMGSKLFYLAKGFEWANRWTLNLSTDFLDSKTDPRNKLETYKRLGVSARSGRKWSNEKTLSDFKLNFDYGGSFDGVKSDPELNYGNEETFRTRFNRFAISSSYSIKAKEMGWWRGFTATLASSYQQNTTERTRFIHLHRTTPAVFTTEDSENDAYLLPYKYTATQKVDGKPFNFFVKVNTTLSVPVVKWNNSLLLGADWNMDKNYGEGQIFDPLKPLYPLTSLRKRALKDIPANHTFAMYMEENIKLPIAKNRLEIVAGARFSRMFNIDRSYIVAQHFYPDIRFNAGWTFPRFKIANKLGSVRLAFGIGSHTKNPTIDQLYPENGYLDITQLNYSHSNQDYRRINIRTYVIDRVNKDLKPARNFKWEVSSDVNYDGYRFSVTLFRENMTSGFRSVPIYAPYSYKEYNTTGINANTLTAPPSLESLPYTIVSELFARDRTSNGSRTLKEGIEYTLSTKRFENIHTRLTINGAWFRTTYENSQSVMVRPSAVLNNRQIGHVGIYKDNDRLTTEMANTNFTADTDIPRLKLGFSISAQCLWFTASQRKPLSNIPDSYMDAKGNVHQWQQGDEKDVTLRWLIRDYNQSYYKRDVVPFSMNLNFKVTKKLLRDRLNVAMFCNKLWDYTPDYKDGTILVRRHVNPYFGLELNVKL